MMRKNLVAVVIGSLLTSGSLLCSTGALADSKAGATVQAGGSRITAEQRARLNDKLRLIDHIMNGVEAEMQAAGLGVEARQSMRERMYGLSLGQIRSMGAPVGLVATESAIASASKVSPKSLGDLSDDLVYTPFGPCRYIDTNNYNGGLKINGIRAFDTDLNGASYGGVASCAPASFAGNNANNIAAYSLNLTIVDTSAAGSPGFATMRPAGSSQVSALVNWTVSSSGFQLGNAAIVTGDQTGAADEIEIQTSGAVRAVVDMAGIFAAPVQTPLECTTVTNTVNMTTANTYYTVTAACTAAYTMTGGGCWFHFGTAANVDSMIVHAPASAAPTTTWFCGGTSTQAANILEVNTRCCRVPGRP